MALSFRIRLVGALHRRTGNISTMSLEQIRAARRSRVPRVPVGQALVDRVAQGLLGAPRAGVTVRETTVGGAVGDLPARWYRPQRLLPGSPLIVYYHGGGWTLGSPAVYDWVCSSLAEDVGAMVVSVDYRKAPEDPAPAAYDDAVASLRWIAAHRDRFEASGQLAVAGDSAGGNLSALAALAVRGEADVPLAAQVLVYPGVDLTLSFPSVDRLREEPFLSRAEMESFREHYLSGGVSPDDTRVSPWFVEDLSGVAPALVQTAGHDPLVDEGEAYAARLEKAGVTVRQTRYVDVPHGFLSIPGLTPLARQALAEASAFLRDRL